MTDLELVIVGLMAAAFGYYAYLRRRLQARYGRDHAAYNSRAFQEIEEPGPDERFVYVTRLATEFENKNGIKAVPMAALSRGMALHQINKNGTFSAKGPYFVSWYSHNWRPTGNSHLIKVLRGKKGWGFSPDHYNQKGVITEKGVCIMEYNTNLHRALTLREFAGRGAKP